MTVDKPVELAKRHKTTAIYVGVTVFLSVLFWASPIWYSCNNRAKVFARVEAVNPLDLKNAGRSLQNKLPELRAKGLTAKYKHKYEEFGDTVQLWHDSVLYETECPKVIKDLRPAYVAVTTNYVFVYISIMPRITIWMFDNPLIKDMKGHKLGDEVWLYE